jgi:N-acylneuraminate cytidylyltransferase
MNALAIIPARGGSKRIPRKNIRPFLGKPIIAYAIETALKAACFEEVMVSTDDPEIAEIAQKHHASVPFLRSAETSNDLATTVDVLREVLTEYERILRNFDLICCIYPTAVLTRPGVILSGKNQLLQNAEARCVLPVVQFSYPIQRALYEENGCGQLVYPEHQATRSQDLRTSYHDAGQWYWLRATALKQPCFSILGSRPIMLTIPEMDAHDIDNESDWHLAELKYSVQAPTT